MSHEARLERLGLLHLKDKPQELAQAMAALKAKIEAGQSKALTPEEKAIAKRIAAGWHEHQRALLAESSKGKAAAQNSKEAAKYQKLVDEKNIKLNRLCGGLEAPYLLTPSQETSEKSKPCTKLENK